MRKIKEVLRLKYSHALSERQIARSCGISRSTVAEYLMRARAAGLGWPLPDDLDEAGIEAKLFPSWVGQGDPGANHRCLTASRYTENYRVTNT